MTRPAHLLRSQLPGPCQPTETNEGNDLPWHQGDVKAAGEKLGRLMERSEFSGQPKEGRKQ